MAAQEVKMNKKRAYVKGIPTVKLADKNGYYLDYYKEEKDGRYIILTGLCNDSLVGSDFPIIGERLYLSRFNPNGREINSEIPTEDVILIEIDEANLSLRLEIASYVENDVNKLLNYLGVDAKQLAGRNAKNI